MYRMAVVMAAAVALSAPASRARATVMVEVAIEDLARDADAIVQGVVVHSAPRWVLKGASSELHTVTTVRVDAWLKGRGGATVELEEFGGVAQGVGMRVDGVPSYAPGERVVLFLERHPLARARFRTLEMIQGKFTIQLGLGGVPPSVRRDLGAVAFARWVGGAMQVAPGGREPAMGLAEFLDLVRGAVALGRAE